MHLKTKDFAYKRMAMYHNCKVLSISAHSQQYIKVNAQ